MYTENKNFVLLVLIIFVRAYYFCYSFEGGFSKFSSSEQAKGELLSPLMRFPTETVAKLYSRVTDQRLRIDVPG